MMLPAPPRLRPGDLVAVVAPSGPVPRDRFAAGVAALGDRYRLRFDEGLFARTGFLAGSDERRLDELRAALSDPSVRGVLCARGGYGVTRILTRLPPALLGGAGRIVGGFSDLTALHLAAASVGLRTLHAPDLAQLGRLADPAAAAADLIARLESPLPPPPWTGLRVVSPGAPVTGTALGGNLELITRLVGTPLAPSYRGAVLFLEEVTERPYRIDRQLTQLIASGLFAEVAAVVVGALVRCDDLDDPEGILRGDDVVRERLGGLGIPVLADAPFGHGTENRCFPHGAAVRVDAGSGTVEFLEGAVS